MADQERELPEVNKERCTGCGRCVAACPIRLFTLDACGYRKHARLRDPDACIGCGRCIAACPVAALRWRDQATETSP